MAALERWCRVTVVGPDGLMLRECVVEGPGAPDLGAVDHVARLALQAGRRGATIVVTEVSPAMRDLLQLAGLPIAASGDHPSDRRPS